MTGSPTLPPDVSEKLPRLEWLTRDALVAQAKAEGMTQRLAEHGCLAPIGMKSRLPHLAELQEARERLEAQAARDWREVTRLGGQVTDRRLGVVDLPATIADREVLLCWQLGEATLGFWHERREGCHQRRSLDLLIPSASGG